MSGYLQTAALTTWENFLLRVYRNNFWSPSLSLLYTFSFLYSTKNCHPPFSPRLPTRFSFSDFPFRLVSLESFKYLKVGQCQGDYKQVQRCGFPNDWPIKHEMRRNKTLLKRRQTYLGASKTIADTCSKQRITLGRSQNGIIRSTWNIELRTSTVLLHIRFRSRIRHRAP